MFEADAWGGAGVNADFVADDSAGIGQLIQHDLAGAGGDSDGLDEAWPDSDPAGWRCPSGATGAGADSARQSSKAADLRRPPETAPLRGTSAVLVRVVGLLDPTLKDQKSRMDSPDPSAVPLWGMVGGISSLYFYLAAESA